MFLFVHLFIPGCFRLSPYARLVSVLEATTDLCQVFTCKFQLFSDANTMTGCTNLALLLWLKLLPVYLSCLLCPLLSVSSFHKIEILQKNSVGIQYAMVGMAPGWSTFFSVYFTCILIALSATGYGYMISALAPTIEAANALAPPLMGRGHNEECLKSNCTFSRYR